MQTEEPEILKAAKEMMVVLRKIRDNQPDEWDAIMRSSSSTPMLNAWSRLKSAVIQTEREVVLRK